MPSRAVRIAAAVCVSALALGACERRAAPAKPPVSAPAAPPLIGPVAPGGFSHDTAFDAQGYYVPVTPITAGNLTLRQIAFGAPSDFRQWEGGAKEAAFGPILLYFDDPTSAAAGDARQQAALRVLPTAYSVTKSAVTFRASDPKVGKISFVGAIDPKVLAQVQSIGAGESRLALSGTLHIGEATFENARFTYVMGD